MSVPNILIIEYDQEINNLICDALKNLNYNVIQILDGRQVFKKYKIIKIRVTACTGNMLKCI